MSDEPNKQVRRIVNHIKKNWSASDISTLKKLKDVDFEELQRVAGGDPMTSDQMSEAVDDMLVFYSLAEPVPGLNPRLFTDGVVHCNDTLREYSAFVKKSHTGLLPNVTSQPLEMFSRPIVAKTTDWVDGWRGRELHLSYTEEADEEWKKEVLPKHGITDVTKVTLVHLDWFVGNDTTPDWRLRFLQYDEKEMEFFPAKGPRYESSHDKWLTKMLCYTSLSYAVMMRERWSVSVGYTPDRRVRFITDPSGAKEFFKDRDTPDNGTRKKALRNWVRDHWRQHRTDKADEVYVRAHLRGATEFTWRGMSCRIDPSEQDFAVVGILQEMRKKLRKQKLDRRKLLRKK